MRITEKARSVAEDFGKIRHQGKVISEYELKNTKEWLSNGQYITSSQSETKLSSAELVGRKYGIGRSTVSRLLRIDRLDESLKQKLDYGFIGITAAVELSYLKKDEQIMLAGLTHKKLVLEKAQNIRRASAKGILTKEVACQIIDGHRKIRTRSLVISESFLSMYYPDISVGKAKKEIEDIAKVWAEIRKQYNGNINAHTLMNMIQNTREE